tara:strand:- start:703 stop:1536 length:834 start_codon:yes stop_codon:yes gene_type:complete
MIRKGTPMSNAWTVLKQNVATTNVQYGSHMPEIKPHPAAVSMAQRQGYQPDGNYYASGNQGANKNPQPQPNQEHPMGGNTQGNLPGRKIELMPRPNAGINNEPNMQNMGISPTTGRQMEDEAYDMDYDSAGRQSNSYNEGLVSAARNTKSGNTRLTHYPGKEGDKFADRISGPIGSDNPRINQSQMQGDLDHLDRYPMNEGDEAGLANSRMNQRHVKNPSSMRRRHGTNIHDKDGRRNENVPVRDFDDPQQTQNLVATGYPMAMNHAWSIVKQQQQQ